MNTHWIALYLSGQYPGMYTVPNKLDIIFKIRQIDSTNFSDTMIWLLHGKSDVEYFKTLLDSFKDIHGEDKLTVLLERLSIPNQVRHDPYEEIGTKEIVIPEHDKKTIWFITPFDKKHEKLQKIIQTYLNQNFSWWKIEVASLEKDGDGKYLWTSIDEFLEKYPLYVVDFRDSNLNVAIELGGILKTWKPCITIVEDKLPSDITWFIYVRKPKVAMEDDWTEDAQKKFLEDFSIQLKRYIK